MNDVKYFESHVTIEPVFGERHDRFAELCAHKRFKAAKLLMQKDRTESPERSNKDSFCTGHGSTYEEIHERMQALVILLRAAGFQVWRYKIEAVVLDVKLERQVSV